MSSDYLEAYESLIDGSEKITFTKISKITYLLSQISLNNKNSIFLVTGLIIISSILLYTNITTRNLRIVDFEI